MHVPASMYTQPTFKAVLASTSHYTQPTFKAFHAKAAAEDDVAGPVEPVPGQVVHGDLI